MNVLDLAEAILKQYPDLYYMIEDGNIAVAPPTTDGFSVMLRLDEEGRAIWIFINRDPMRESPCRMGWET